MPTLGVDPENQGPRYLNMTPLRTAILGCGAGCCPACWEYGCPCPKKLALVASAIKSRIEPPPNAQKYGAPGRRSMRTRTSCFERGKTRPPRDLLPPYGHYRRSGAGGAGGGSYPDLKKPIALDLAQAWQMVADVEKAGDQAQVGFMMRFGRAVERSSGDRERSKRVRG